MLQFTEFVTKMQREDIKKGLIKISPPECQLKAKTKINKDSCCPSFFTVPELFDVQKVSVLDFMTDHQTPRSYWRSFVENKPACQ